MGPLGQEGTEGQRIPKKVVKELHAQKEQICPSDLPQSQNKKFHLSGNLNKIRADLEIQGTRGFTDRKNKLRCH